ncbi:FecR family protein [Cyclobacterium sp. SYSU L10401]|uniref:FecR family protein n=2 Tax=unclassified Cyclobacterium TaxID=2615055 RepID=UPI0013D1D2A1|nr:FecR domain-containing protein [Cyclobacterium sp. SYSU L10401]
MEKQKDITFLLLTDPEFVRWVRKPNGELDTYWKNWMLAHPDKVEQVKKAREIIVGLQLKQTGLENTNKYKVLQQILATEKAETGTSGKVATLQRNPFFWLLLGQWTKVAAILVLTLMSIFVLSRMSLNPPVVVAPEKPDTPLLTKVTQFGEKLNFKLPDGSSVWLNSGSELIFPEKFDSLERRVSLIGEGFFDVHQDSSRTFRVVSGDLITDAIGTSFNVKYSEKDELAVSLVSGKIKVNHDSLEHGLFLEPGEQLRYRDSSNSFELTSFSPENITGWKDGLLQFTDAGFDEVIGQLERWYGVKISISGKPGHSWRLSGKYKNQNLDLVLDRMAYIEKFEYSIIGKNVNLKF